MLGKKEGDRFDLQRTAVIDPIRISANRKHVRESPLSGLEFPRNITKSKL
jgi:hypothetical protein